MDDHPDYTYRNGDSGPTVANVQALIAINGQTVTEIRACNLIRAFKEIGISESAAQKTIDRAIRCGVVKKVHPGFLRLVD